MAKQPGFTAAICASHANPGGAYATVTHGEPVDTAPRTSDSVQLAADASLHGEQDGDFEGQGGK